MHSMRAIFLAGIATAIFPAVSGAEDTRPPGYVTESYPGARVVTDAFGNCWHDGFWSPADGQSSCDPNAPKATAAAAPEPVKEAAPPPAPPPPPAPVAETPPPPPEPVAVAPLNAAESSNETVLAAPPPPAPPENPKLETALLPQTVHYSDDAFFDFDESALKADGKSALDKLAKELGDVQYGKIRVVGHTDRIGTDAYNLGLSKRRAAAVKDYLVSKEIPADRIDAVGKGKAEPVTKPGQCPGAKSAKVVACLQPDRRVDIEVSGTKEVAASK